MVMTTHHSCASTNPVKKTTSVDMVGDVDSWQGILILCFQPLAHPHALTCPQHFMLEKLTGFYPSPKSFRSCTHVNSYQ